MNRDKQIKDVGLVEAEKRRWQFVAFSLLAFLALLVLVLLGKSTSTKTIFIPPNANAAGKPFWVADAGASPEYFQMTADYVAQLALTGDAKNAPYNLDRLLAIAHPAIKGALKAQMDAVALKMRKENLTQVFYPLEYTVGDNKPVVAIKGTLKTWVGDKLISSRDTLYRLAFSIETGRIYLTEFKEASASDPLNETLKPEAAPNVTP